MDLDGVGALVTGGASGLGAATARALTAAGAAVTVLDRQVDRGEALVAELGGGARFVETDVTDPGAVAAAVATAADGPPLRAVAICAGIGDALRTVGRDGTPHDLARFQKVVSVNLVGSFLALAHVAGVMSQLDPLPDGSRGAVVMTASVAAFDGQIGQLAYAASKGGIVGMTLPAARDLSAVGIRVNTIAPGIMDTPLLALASQPVRDALGASVLYPKRLGLPEEYAALALALLTNGYMNGATVRLDGGIRMPPK